MAEIQMSVCSVLLFLLLSGCVFLSVWLVVIGESVASVLGYYQRKNKPFVG